MVSTLLSSKWSLLLVAGLCITNVVQYLRADTYESEISRLSTVVESREADIAEYQRAIQLNNEDITALTQERVEMVQLLDNRAEQHNQIEQQLQNDIENLRKELDTQRAKDPEMAKCLSRRWPDAIAEQLLKDY